MLIASTAGWFGLGILALFIWIAIAFWPARVARRKGHSWLGFLIPELVLLPTGADLGLRRRGSADGRSVVEPPVSAH
jgi:hypothetical protein